MAGGTHTHVAADVDDFSAAVSEIVDLTAANLQGQIDTQALALAAHTTTLEDHGTTLDTLSTYVSDCEADLSAVEQDVDALKSDTLQLETQATAAAATVSALGDRVTACEEDDVQMTTDIASVSAEQAVIQMTQEELTSRLAAAIARITELEAWVQGHTEPDPEPEPEPEGDPEFGPIYFINDNINNFPAASRQAVHDNTKALKAVGGREMVVWSHDAAGNLLNPHQWDALLQTYRDNNLLFLARILPVNANTWTTGLVEAYSRNVADYIYNQTDWHETVYRLLGSNEPDTWGAAAITARQQAFYDGIKAAGASIPVVTLPLISVANAVTSTCWVTNAMQQWADEGDIHVYDIGMSKWTLTGAANPYWLGRIVDFMNSAGVVRPMSSCEWGAGTDHASGNLPSVLHWKAAAHAQGRVTTAQFCRWSCEYSAQESHTFNGTHNFYNWPGYVRPAGEADGPRQPAWWSKIVHGNVQNMGLAAFDGFNDIPDNIWRYMAPWVVTFYARNQSGLSTQWFEEWDSVTMVPPVRDGNGDVVTAGYIVIEPDVKPTEVRRIVTGLIPGHTYTVSLEAQTVQATRDASHYVNLWVQGHSPSFEQPSAALAGTSGTISVQFTATNPWTVIGIETRGLDVTLAGIEVAA